MDEILATLDTFPYSPHTKEPMGKRFVLKHVFINQKRFRDTDFFLPPLDGVYGNHKSLLKKCIDPYRSWALC